MGEAQEKRPLLPEWALATAAREIGGLTAAATLLQHGGAGCALLRPDSAGLLPGKGEGIIGQNKAPGAMLQALLSYKIQSIMVAFAKCFQFSRCPQRSQKDRYSRGSVVLQRGQIG